MNNAVQDASGKLDCIQYEEGKEVYRNHCESASIMDGYNATCGSAATALDMKKQQGFLTGSQRFKICNDEAVEDLRMQYDLCLILNKEHNKCQIHAHYKCGTKTLINFGGRGGGWLWTAYRLAMGFFNLPIGN